VWKIDMPVPRIRYTVINPYEGWRWTHRSGEGKMIALYRVVNLLPQVPKFSVIMGDFSYKKERVCPGRDQNYILRSTDPVLHPYITVTLFKRIQNIKYCFSFIHHSFIHFINLLKNKGKSKQGDINIPTAATFQSRALF
jgi:hypothetical protein